MRLIEHFKHCPRCGHALPPRSAPNNITCAACGFLQFFNPTVAAAVFVVDAADRVLLIRRAKDPGKGMLAPPGGFVDFEETVETALRREIREEIGLELGAVQFLCSAVNDYQYRDVTYPVVDLFFTARVDTAPEVRALEDVEDIVWLPRDQVCVEELAFASMQEAFRALQRTFGKAS